MASLGILGTDGKIFRGSSSTSTSKKRKDDEDIYVSPTVSTAPALSVIGSQPRTVQPTQTVTPILEPQKKKETKKEKQSFKDAVVEYGKSIRNARTLKDGVNWDNIVTDVGNIYDAKRRVASATPYIGGIYDTISNTAGNIATNLGEGAIKSVEGAADFASDVIFNPVEQRYNYAYDLLTKGKKTADENLEDLKKMQQRDIATDRTGNILNNYFEALPNWEKGSLIKRGNLGGQVAQGVGGMVPSLVLGQAFGGTPELSNLSGLTGKERLAAMAGNVGRTYMSQLPANAMLGASSYGSGVEQALNKGASMNQARAYGLANAAIEQGTEMLTGGVPGLEGKGGLDQFVEPLIEKTGKGFLNAFIKAGYGALGEGLEESAGTYLDALARKAILGEEIEWNEVNKEALQSGLLGAITGAILNTPSNIQNFSDARAEQVANREIEQRYNDQLKDVEIKDNTPSESSEAKSPVVNKINDTLQKVQGAKEGEDYTRLIKQPTMREIVSSEKQAQNDYLNNTIEGLKPSQEAQTETERPITQEERKVPGEEDLEPITQREENIDNSQQKEYNESVNEKEGEANDLRTIQERGNSLSKEEHDALYGGDKSGIKGIRDNIKRVLQPRMESIIRSNNDSRKPLKNGFAEVNNNDFEQIFKANHPYLRNPDTVTPYGAEDYKNNKNYLSEDGLSGFSITQNGDLISVFNNSGKPGMLQRISDTVKSEAKTLDCFNSTQQDLPSLYQDAFGFKTAAIMDFNYDIMAEEHGKEYADAFVKKYGEAPVHFMVKSDQDVPVKHFNKDQYEEAMNYRDSFVGEGTSDSSFSNVKEENQGKAEKVVDNKITAETLKKMSKDLTKELNESFKLKKNEAYSRTPQTAVKSMSVYENAPAITDFDRNTVVHTIMGDEAAKIDAKTRYEKNGSLEENAAYIRGLLQSDKRLTKNDKALAIYTMNEAYKQGNKAIGDGIVSDLTVLDVEAGQWAQASKLMKQMSPFGQLQTFVKMINNSVEKGNPRFKNVKITEEQINKVLDCYDKDGNWDADKFAKNMEEFKFDIQQQMTPTLMDKFNSVRMLGMLGSPRTHIRNMFGNVGNMGLRTVKNFNDRVLESILIRNNTEQRTRTFKPATKEVKDYVSNLTKEELLSGNKYNDTKTELERTMKVFNENHKGMAKILNPISKAMNKLSDGNSWALDMEDKLFSSFAYKRSLQEFLTARGIQTVEDINSNPKVLAKGKEFAMQQALEATYRQDSELATAISNYVKKTEKTNAKKTDKFLGLIVESNIPFKKTPINIAKTGIEFSPIGLTTGVYDTLANVKSGKVEMSQAIDEISKGVTGLGLLGIGALLAHNGFELQAADDDKEKKAKYDKSLGEMEYSIKVGDRYYDLSWMAPASMPLYTGIELYQTLVNEKKLDGNAVINTLAKTIDPLSSMSLLEGLSKSVQSYSKSPGEFISKFTLSSLENYVTQYIPTLLSQIANFSDDRKRYTGAAGDSDFTELEKTWNSIKIKVPGLRQTLPEQTDAWGRTQMNDPVGLRFFNSFINPANNTKDKKDATDRELERLYNDLGEDNYYATRSLPKMSFNKYLTIDKQKVDLSNEELVKYKKTYGKTAKDGADKLIKTDEYKKATDEEKAQMLTALYDYANQKAKEEYGKEHNLDYDDYKLDQLYSIVDAFDIPIEKAVSNKSIQQLKAEGGLTSKQRKIAAVNNIEGLSSLQKDALKRKFTMFMGNPGYKQGEYALVDALDDSNVSEETKEDIKRFLSLD